jgi:hypothetical protein
MKSKNCVFYQSSFLRGIQRGENQLRWYTDLRFVRMKDDE